jgi:hypothetical protein
LTGVVVGFTYHANFQGDPTDDFDLLRYRLSLLKRDDRFGLSLRPPLQREHLKTMKPELDRCRMVE